MAKWERAIGWALTGLLALLVAAIVVGYFVLESDGFKQYALGKIAAEAQVASGAKTEIGGLDFSLSTLTAHLYNITMRGTENSDHPPLLHADELTVSVKVISAWRRQISLSELLVNHPVVYLQVGKDGKSNLPAAPQSQNSSRTSVFDLAVRHAQIINGEINYNDRKTPLEADLHDLSADIRFAGSAPRYDGNISYEDGHLQYGPYQPLPHNLSLKFSATPEQFDLQSAELKVGSSDLTLQTRVTNYANPVAEGKYAIWIHTQDFRQFSPALAPTGDVMLTGDLHYQSGANRSLLRNLSIDGRIASEMLTAVASQHRVAVQKLRGSYQLAGGDLKVSDVKFEALGGRISGDAVMAHLDEKPNANITASLSNISLRSLQHTLGKEHLEGARVVGTIGGRVTASWKQNINHLRAHADLSLQARAGSKSNPAAAEIPVNGAVHASYDAASQTIELHDTSVAIPSASLTAAGTVSQNSKLQIQVKAGDLHQLAALASSFETQTTIPVISGSATLAAEIRGSVKKPTISAKLKADDVRVENSEWPRVEVSLFANPSQIVIQSALLADSHRGQVNFHGSVVLRDWAYDPAGAIKANLGMEHLRIAELLDLVNQHYPVTGDLSAKLHFDGSQLNPEGSGSMQIANAQVDGEPIQELAVNFQAHSGSIDSALKATSKAGEIDANFSYIPTTRSYKVRMNAPSIVLQKLKTVQERNADLSGTVTAWVNGAGTTDNPQLDATIQLPQLQLRQNSIGDVKAELHVEQHAADVKLDSVVALAAVHAHANMALSGDYDTDAAIDTGTIPLNTLAATYSPGVPPGFQGQAELHATLKGPLKDKSRIEAHLSIPVLRASYQSLQMAIAQPLRADYSHSIVTLQPVELTGTDTSLRVQGRLPLTGNSSPTLAAKGQVDLRILKIVAPDLASSGALTVDLHATTSAGHPALQGQMQLKDVSASTETAPVGISKLNGTLDLNNSRLQITKMTGQLGGGEFSVGGSIAYQPAVQFNLALQAKSVRLLYPDGLRSSLDANLAYSGTLKTSILNGRVEVSRISFTPDFDLSKFSDQFSTSGTISQPGFADTVKLAIAVQSQDLNATSSQISLAGGAYLQVSGTAADPVITGRTMLTSGELFYRNVRYQLQAGAITFDNPTETHPVMNVSVTTTIEQYNLTLGLRGPLDKLTTSYSSDPPLATADIINLVARGKTTQESAAQSQSTDSMIASQAASEVSGGLQKLAGISSLQIDPTIGGNGQSPSTQIAIQQRVTKNLLFTFSTDVSQPGSEMIQGEYQINKRWSVDAERDQLGGFSVGGRFHKHF